VSGALSRTARLAALCGLVLAAAAPAGAQPAAQTAAAESGYGGPFTLVDQDGRKVTDRDFRGRWMLIYFGYTHCPDACPTALNDMAEALDRLPEEQRKRVQPIFVTIDPERDTPAVLKDYVGAFEGADIVGLTGSAEQVAEAAKAYRVFAKKRERQDDPADYSMDHTSNLYVMDPEGKYVTMVSHLLPPEKLATRLAQLVK
jgi:cytochrome oxidase Cu insertion factor (SCO1/SenC/PrrC family)